MKLTTKEVEEKLNTNTYSLPKPGCNKGDRGKILENLIGIQNTSDLKDLIDGELKTYTIGQTIAVTQLKHCLKSIINDSVEFADSKVYEKLQQTIYVAFTRNNEYVKSKTINENNSPIHYKKLAEDYGYISAHIRNAYMNQKELNTITGPNKLLQIRTKASKSKSGQYTPLCYNGIQLKDKYMAFYLCSTFGKEIAYT
jgi:hypothetical protein